ncbi:MAG: carboxymuconolactone decarboxylase family protein [Acidimicrobiia bacterium]|nr:carboxymuconolactone decarboxylase family protein [Acidimicrobiia bacterium]
MKDQPRITPIALDEADESVRPVLVGLERHWSGLPNVFGTLARHPQLFGKWLPFASHVLVTTSLPPRERELAILRTAQQCSCEYELGHHRHIGVEAGLDAAEVEATGADLDEFDWAPRERALLSAVDALCADHDLDDATWAEVCAHFDTMEVYDLVFCVGAYSMLSMALNSFRVQPDDRDSG